MKKKYILLIVIFLVALFARFYNLSSIPTGFHIDEASLGYNAYSLMMTGKDASGKAFPLYISMFGDNNPSGYYYLAILPIKILGLTEFATRLPAAIFGSISVFAIYLLSYAIFDNKKIGLLSALLLALSPWGIVLSRTSAETLVACFFVILGFGLVLLSLKNQNIPRLLIGAISLFLSFFIYPSPRVFVPLFFTTIVIILYPLWLKQKNKNYRNSFIISYLFLIISCAVLIFGVSGGTARFNQVSIFTFPETKLVQEEQIREDGSNGSVIISRIFHNKIISYSLTFLSNYSEYFTGNFLFLRGGLPRLINVPGSGIIYLFEFPFILAGIFFIIRQKNIKYKIILLWILLAPISAAITVDDIPNVRRALIMFPAIEIIASYGFMCSLQFFPKKYIRLYIMAIGFFLFFNISYFMHQYFVHAQIHRTWYRNNGYKEMVNTINKSDKNTTEIIITKSTGGVLPLLLFYSRYNPVTYQNEGSPGDKPYHTFGNYFFVPQECPSITGDSRVPKVKKLVFVDSGTCSDTDKLSKNKKVDIIREDKTKAFRIVYD